MGARGFPKKPAALEAAEGNPGHRPINKDAPEFAQGEPKIPASLSPVARRIWRETVPMMMNVPGLLTVADGAVLADYCEVRADKGAIERAIRSEQAAAVKQERCKSIRRSEAAVRLEVFEQHSELLNQLRHRENVLRRELGLSPSARSSIRVLAPDKPKENPVDTALFGRPRLTAV